MDEVEDRESRAAASAASERPDPLPSRVAEGERSEPSKKTWPRRLFAVGLALFVAAWGWAFWYGAHRPKPEPLDSAAQHLALGYCDNALANLRQLPPVGGAPTVGDRVDRIGAENSIFETLVSELDAIRPTDPSGAKALKGFATDWQNLATARKRYVKELARTGKRPKFFIPIANGAPATIRMGEYADIHNLAVCSPDDLQGEVVEGPRVYPHA